APTEARYEVLQDVRLYVAEGRLRLGSDAVRERLEDAALEVRTWMQRSDLGPLAVTDVVIADAQHVVLHTGGDQRDLGFHELRDTRAGVQGDGRPHAPDAVLGTRWPCRNWRASSALSTSNRRPLVRNCSLR